MKCFCPSFSIHIYRDSVEFVNGIRWIDANSLQSTDSVYAFISDQKQYILLSTMNHHHHTAIIRQWTYDQRSDLSLTLISQHNLSITPIASWWKRSCGTNEVITGVTSIDTDNIDTQWIWHCAQLDPSRFHLKQCINSGYIHVSIDQYSYQCPERGLVHGIYSDIQSDGTMDRMWGVICCEVHEVDVIGDDTAMTVFKSPVITSPHRQLLWVTDDGESKITTSLRNESFGCTLDKFLSKDFNSPAECAATAMTDTECDTDLIKWSDEYNDEWGCRCCQTSISYSAGTYWDVYQYQVIPS